MLTNMHASSGMCVCFCVCMHNYVGEIGDYYIVIAFHLHSCIRTLFEWVGHKTLLGYIITKACASRRNLIQFTRLFLLVRGWGVGMRLVYTHACV